MAGLEKLMESTGNGIVDAVDGAEERIIEAIGALRTSDNNESSKYVEVNKAGRPIDDEEDEDEDARAEVQAKARQQAKAQRQREADAEARAQVAEAAKWARMSKAEKGKKVHEFSQNGKVDELRILLNDGVGPEDHKVSE